MSGPIAVTIRSPRGIIAFENNSLSVCLDQICIATQKAPRITQDITLFFLYSTPCILEEFSR